MATINIRTVGLEHVKQPYVNLIHFKGSKHDKRELMKLANIQSQIKQLTKIKEECNDSWSANYYQRLINNLRLIVDLGYMRGGAASLPYGSGFYGTVVAATEAIASSNIGVPNAPPVPTAPSAPASSAPASAAATTPASAAATTPASAAATTPASAAATTPASAAATTPASAAATTLASAAATTPASAAATTPADAAKKVVKEKERLEDDSDFMLKFNNLIMQTKSCNKNWLKNKIRNQNFFNPQNEEEIKHNLLIILLCPDNDQKTEALTTLKNNVTMSFGDSSSGKIMEGKDFNILKTAIDQMIMERRNDDGTGTDGSSTTPGSSGTETTEEENEEEKKDDGIGTDTDGSSTTPGSSASKDDGGKEEEEEKAAAETKQTIQGLKKDIEELRKLLGV